MMPAELGQLLEHLEWADAAVWARVLDTPQCAGDRRIAELLIHMHGTEWAYLQLWRDESPQLKAVEDFATLADVARWAWRYHRDRRAFTDALDEAGLERPITFPWAAQLAERFGQVRPASVRQSLLQIGLHSAYHRGQVNARLRELGGEPPLVDFIAWVWAGRPAPQWPALIQAAG